MRGGECSRFLWWFCGLLGGGVSWRVWWRLGETERRWGFINAFVGSLNGRDL